MVFLAIPIGASLGTARSGAFGRNLAIGAGIGILFYLMSQLVQTGGSIAEIPPYVAAFFPATLVLVIASGLMRRMR